VSRGSDQEAKELPPLPRRLATQIIERAKMLNLPAGSHLAEQTLAKAFRVSRTPVRLALHLLEDRNIVESRPNRGYFLRLPPDRLGTFPATFEEPADDDLYLQIAEDRLAGLLPKRFTEAELARRYNLGKARMARLLGRMTKEGWLDRLPGHGWEFQPVLTSVDTYEQSYRFRMLIEPAALQEPGYRIDEAAFARVRAQQRALLEGGVKKFSRIEMFQLGALFHETIVAGSGNAFLLDGLRRVNKVRRLFEYRINKDPSRLVRECTDHLRLLDLLEAGKRGEAVEFLKRHLDRARQLKTGIARRATKAAATAPSANTSKMAARHRTAARKPIKSRRAAAPRAGA
jgi:DNA-binding GntR family transcriptional regulator